MAEAIRASFEDLIDGYPSRAWCCIVKPVDNSAPRFTPHVLRRAFPASSDCFRPPHSHLTFLCFHTSSSAETFYESLDDGGATVKKQEVKIRPPQATAEALDRLAEAKASNPQTAKHMDSARSAGPASHGASPDEHDVQREQLTVAADVVSKSSRAWCCVVTVHDGSAPRFDMQDLRKAVSHRGDYFKPEGFQAFCLCFENKEGGLKLFHALPQSNSVRVKGQEVLFQPPICSKTLVEKHKRSRGKSAKQRNAADQLVAAPGYTASQSTTPQPNIPAPPLEITRTFPVNDNQVFQIICTHEPTWLKFTTILTRFSLSCERPVSSAKNQSLFARGTAVNLELAAMFLQLRIQGVQEELYTQRYYFSGSWYGFVGSTGFSAALAAYNPLAGVIIEREPLAPLPPAPPLAATVISWEVQAATGWQAYEAGQNREIECAHLIGCLTVEITVANSDSPNGNVYRIDFASLKQINIATEFERPIRRVEAAPPSPPARKYIMTLRYLKDEIANKLEAFRTFVTKNLKSQELELSTEIAQRAQAACADLFVEFTIVPKSSENSNLTLTGTSDDVMTAFSRIVPLTAKGAAKASGLGIVLPKHWKAHDDGSHIVEVKLQATDPEYLNVEAKLKATLTHVEIISIKRIQNMKVWEIYGVNHKRVSEQNGCAAKEMSLFHGTSEVDPSVIYADKHTGFHTGHSKEGMWGRGTYFAVKASYSDAYAYRAPDRSKIMMLCKVLVGDSVEHDPDQTLTRPPEKHKGVRHDSVNGETKGSRVFIVYDSGYAYPEYVISYRSRLLFGLY